MKLTRAMREKYRRRLRQVGGVDVHDSYPPGGADVLFLCDLADDLLEIVRWAQRELPVEQQRDVEKRLWLAEQADWKEGGEEEVGILCAVCGRTTGRYGLEGTLGSTSKSKKLRRFKSGYG